MVKDLFFHDAQIHAGVRERLLDLALQMELHH